MPIEASSPKRSAVPTEGSSTDRPNRTELNDLAPWEPQRVKQLSWLWGEWAVRTGVRPWPVKPQVTAKAARGRHIHVVR